MGFSAVRHWPFAAILAAFGLVAGSFVVGGTILAFSGRPALGLIAYALAALALAALVRTARRAERAMRDLVEQLTVGADDQPMRLPAAFADLDSAIVRATDAMREREARHDAQAHAAAALIDTVPAALFVVDAGGRLVRSNRPARTLAPAPPADFAGHPAFAPGDATMLLARPPEIGRMLNLADGRAAHASVSLFELADGSQRRLIAVQPVAEGLGAVETDAWHRLSRVLAHEMMNSLSPIISLAESLVALAENPAADPGRRDTTAAAATIARRAQHLIGFVERYRQWLTIPQPEPEPVDLAEFAADMAALARGFAPRAKISVQGSSPAPVAAMDRELLEQALLNLLKNAVEATCERERPLVTLGYGMEDGDTLLITVEDNGNGLPAAADDIFLPFFTTKAEGAGIGLTIARQIVMAHGGGLTADRLATGAKFSMRLPVDQTGRLSV